MRSNGEANRSPNTVWIDAYRRKPNPERPKEERDEQFRRWKQDSERVRYAMAVMDNFRRLYSHGK